MIRVFSDFDGTITEEDMILSFLKAENPPGWQEIVKRIMEKELTQGEGLKQLYDLIPSSLLPKLLLHVSETAEVRSGFSDFVQYCQERNFALNVISGGLEKFVRPLVELYGVTSVWANQVDSSQEYLKLRIPYSCDDSCEGHAVEGLHCAPCKPSIIRELAERGDFIIVIGDSVSDIPMAKIANFVFARGYLLKECERLGLPCASYETFYDVIEGMEHVTANLQQ